MTVLDGDARPAAGDGRVGVEERGERRSAGEEERVSLPALRAMEPRAFELAFEVFAPRLNGWLLRMGASRAVADELVQEAFLRLARHAPTLRPDTRLGAWLGAWLSHAARPRGSAPGAGPLLLRPSHVPAHARVHAHAQAPTLEPPRTSHPT